MPNGPYGLAASQGSFLYWFLLILAAGIVIAAGIQVYLSKRDVDTATTARVLLLPTVLVLIILLGKSAIWTLQGNDFAVALSSGFWASVVGLLLVVAGGVVVTREDWH